MEPELTARVQLRNFKASAGMSYGKLASIIGTTKQNVHMLLTSSRLPGLRLALAIERATGIPVTAWVPEGALKGEPREVGQ